VPELPPPPHPAATAAATATSAATPASLTSHRHLFTTDKFLGK